RVRMGSNLGSELLVVLEIAGGEHHLVSGLGPNAAKRASHMPGADDADLHLVGCIDDACCDRQDAESGGHTGRLEHVPTSKPVNAVHFVWTSIWRAVAINRKAFPILPCLYFCSEYVSDPCCLMPRWRVTNLCRLPSVTPNRYT